MAVFRNSFRDLYDEAFPWVEEKRKKRDVENPWLDDAEFKELVEEKGRLYSRKLKGLLGEEEGQRLVEVNREVNRLRRKLKREYFDQKISELSGDLRAMWGVLGEVLRGRSGKGGAVCRYFEQDGSVVTDGAKIAKGFCDFYSQVGPKLAARLGREREGAFMEYMGERVEEPFIWRPTTPGEVEELCRGLDTGKAAG